LPEFILYLKAKSLPPLDAAIGLDVIENKYILALLSVGGTSSLRTL
jgi:hypothetical protein